MCSDSSLWFERLKAGGEGYKRGWNGWMASVTQWTWVWASSGRQWKTGKPGVLQSMESQSIGHDLATEQQMTNDVELCFMSLLAICTGDPWMTQVSFFLHRYAFVHYIPMSYFCYNWNFVPFYSFHSFCPTPTLALGSHQLVLIICELLVVVF